MHQQGNEGHGIGQARDNDFLGLLKPQHHEVVQWRWLIPDVYILNWIVSI